MTSKRPQSHPFPAGVSQPAIRAMHSVGITSLDQLPAFTEAELIALHGMGPKAIRILREALAAQGRSFRAA